MILYDRCVAAGMLDQIDPDRPVPELRMPFHTRADGSPDTVTSQMFWDSDFAKIDRDRRLCALPAPQSRPRGEDRRHHRHVRTSCSSRTAT